MNLFLRALLALVAALLATTALAGPGHDHDAAPASGSQASPRFDASSDLFELVGIADGDTLVLYLDRFENNEPVTGAAVEVELLAAGGQPVKTSAAAQPDGTYVFKSDLFGKPGDYALQITVTAGQDLDILAGNLTIPGAASDADAHEHSLGTRPLVIGVIGLFMVLVLAAALLRRRRLAGAAA